MKMKKLALAASVAITSMWSSHAAAAEIQFWHAFTGRLGELVAEQIEKFNASQDKHTVVGSHKGNYSETLNAGIAAFRAKEQPHILMVSEEDVIAVIEAGDLKARKIGRAYRISRKNLEAFLDG